MASVTIHLQEEAERCLTEKAKQDGQTLEDYLERMIEHHVLCGAGVNDAGEATDEYELAKRPWRGVFAPPRQRGALSTHNLSLRLDRLPRRQPSMSMSWHRVATDDE